MKSLTVAYITARHNPEIHWFFESLLNDGLSADMQVIVVQPYCDPGYWPIEKSNGMVYRLVRPKPSIWQGSCRLTSGDWWAIANARNTAMAYCQTEWIALLDDRSVILPGYMKSISQAMAGGYAVCGAYGKRHNMKVDNGVIVDHGEVTGEDAREIHSRGRPMPMVCGGEWWFGCNHALPLEWALNINGADETCDSLGLEDVIFGLHLQNAGYPIRFDSRMKMIEDRTPNLSGPVIKRTDKGISPNDKSHALLNRLRHLKRSTNPFDLREIRATVLAGGDFPIPTGPTHDWYDGQPLAEM